MEQIYKGYATFDAMTQTDFFFRTDAKKRSAGMYKAAAECIMDHRLRRGCPAYGRNRRRRDAGARKSGHSV